MLFDKRRRVINRLLIVEDEPLIAFNNEHLLGEAGYEIVATVDRAADAIRIIEQSPLDLVLADVRLTDGDGIGVARLAHTKGIAVLLVTGACPADAAEFSLGCLSKPFRDRDLVDAIGLIESRIQGKTRKRIPTGFTFYSL